VFQNSDDYRKINTNGQNNDRTVVHVVNIYKIYLRIILCREYCYVLYNKQNMTRHILYNADYAQCVNASILSCLYDFAVQLYEFKQVFICGK